MNIYISIGAQCTTASLFDKLDIKKETLPFDWMFSTPEFVYTILHLLLVDKKEIDNIIDNHFFICDKRARLQQLEHHILDENGSVLVNSKYNVCFPHDTANASDRDKYIRRMERLKQIILNNDVFIYFIYVSVSSPTIGNYTINSIEYIQHLYDYIEKINNIIKTVRTNYKIIIFDTNKPSDIVSSDTSHIIYYDIQKKYWWIEMLPELIDKFNSLINAKIIYK